LRQACEIRLRAERKAGELLKVMEAKGERQKRGGDRKGKSKSPAGTLKDLGISGKQSSKWQRLASVPEKDFEAALSAIKKPSTTASYQFTRYCNGQVATGSYIMRK